MILTAQTPASGPPSIPFSFLEEVKRVMSQHKAVRLVPEDEAVTVEEAATVLGAKVQLIREMLHLGVLKRTAAGDNAAVVRLDSLLELQKRAALSPRDDLDEFFDALEEQGLY